MATKKKPTRKATASKTAKPAKASGQKSAAKGKRYSNTEKQQILTFIEKVNDEKGRGGATAASKEFKVSLPTINNWLRNKGGAAKPTAKPTAKPKGGRGGGGKPTGGSSDVLDQLVALREEISGLESQLAAKQAQFDQLKAAL